MTAQLSTLRWIEPHELKRYDLRLITRCQYERSRGWWVRVERVGFRRARFFSDRRCGGRLAALDAAVLFRDAAEAEAPAKRPKPAPPHKPKGRIYLARKTYLLVRGKRVFYDAWIAYYLPPNGRRSETSYSCAKWGSKLARAKAESWLLHLQGRSEEP